MEKIKTIEEIKKKVAREEELLSDVLISAFRIVESYEPSADVAFDAQDIVEFMGIGFEQLYSTMYALERKGLLEVISFGGGNGSSFKISCYGREAARDLLLQQIEEMEKIQNESGRENVFIIHGHDEEFKNEIYDFIKQLNLHPVVLHEVEDRGRTIIEKLEDQVKLAKYAISLWSPDDMMFNGNSRPRQNVILETGIFCNELTRKGVRILVKGKVEIPSDLDGVLRTHIDKSENWKNELTRELKAAGINF